MEDRDIHNVHHGTEYNHDITSLQWLGLYKHTNDYKPKK